MFFLLNLTLVDYFQSLERVRPAVFFALLGIYFSITTLADGHELGFTLLYAFAIVYLAVSAITLLYNAGRPELPAQAENDTNDTTEGTPDEP